MELKPLTRQQVIIARLRDLNLEQQGLMAELSRLLSDGKRVARKHKYKSRYKKEAKR